MSPAVVQQAWHVHALQNRSPLSHLNKSKKQSKYGHHVSTITRDLYRERGIPSNQIRGAQLPILFAERLLLS